MNQGMFLTSGTLEGLSIEGEGKLFCEMGSFCFPFRQLPVSITTVFRCYTLSRSDSDRYIT